MLLIAVIFFFLLASIIAMIHKLFLLGSDGDGFNLIAAIVVPLFIMVVMIIIIIVVLSLCLWKFRQKTQGNQVCSSNK